MMALSHVVDSLVIAQKAKTIKDMGLGAISIIGLLIAITMAANIFLKDIRGLRGYALLSKPISRIQFIVGKYLGALITLAVIIVLMGCVLMVDAAAMEGSLDRNLVVGVHFIFVELSVITAFGLLFSTFCAPMTSGLLTFAFYVVGHLTHAIQGLVPSESLSLKQGLYWVLSLLPDLEKFNLKADVVYQTLPAWHQLMLVVLYGAIYVFVALFLSWLVIRRRDIL
jgi:ABC-type transport system involved in multi-copper enzyme maturation permease subunit